MNRIFASLIVLCATYLVALQAASAVTIAWTPVENPGNANDPATSNLYGGVNYNFNIGKYDVTNSQYVEFLNSNVPDGETADPLALYNINMSNATYGGIAYNAAAASGSKYSVISGRGDNPVNYETFFDALRFTNWLNNGQAPGSTETGAYTLFGGTPTPTNGNSIARNTGATVFLPSENEWYKAAYYNPATSSYYQYPTGSNTVPTATSPTATPNSSNFNNAVGNLTAVGSYTGTTSPYGAFDMGGDVKNWNEAFFASNTRGARGGPFTGNSSFLQSSSRTGTIAIVPLNNVGFRVVSVPEPGTGVMAVLAVGSMWLLRRRFK